MPPKSMKTVFKAVKYDKVVIKIIKMFDWNQFILEKPLTPMPLAVKKRLIHTRPGVSVVQPLFPTAEM